MVILNLVLFSVLIFILFRYSKHNISLSRQVLAGLVGGTLYGFFLQFAYADDNTTISGTLSWTNIIGSGYVNLLKMIVMPLVLVMMISAVLRMKEIAAVGKIGSMVIGILVATTAIAALVGIFVANGFGLTADGLTEGVRELARAEVLNVRQERVSDLTLPQILISFIPTNIFADLTGARSTSIIAVVIFGILFGIAALLVGKENPEQGESIDKFVDATMSIIMKLVRLIMLITPYGILALMSKVIAGSNGEDILSLLNFIVASYVAILIMFIVHALILTLLGIGATGYFKKVWPVLTFAFTSRSSAATIPLNVETQIKEFGVPSSIANLSATFGSTIGQNGCAGIYPAMLAAMIAPTLGIDPLEPMFLLSLVGIVTISSFGVAGVGGGATFAALIVLPAMGFPVALVALLISIEPLIDMARTALNVNGSMTAGIVTSRLLKMESKDSVAETA
ncbi:MAG: L-cystine uptake protein TcyP (sodium:dicarboxylate symporter family) [Candidatus Azotimanducaceae bacterium]|jgi:L-cystine uptake protein TcyP (sodium:dicarboxylate symporter family)